MLLVSQIKCSNTLVLLVSQIKCSNTLELFVSQIKLIERTKKIHLDLGIEMGIGSLSTISTSRGVIESSKRFHAQKGGAEMVPSCLVITAQLKKSP